jgi:hypothetical protein
MCFIPTEIDNEEKRRATGMGNVLPPPLDSSEESAHAVLTMPTAAEEPELVENVPHIHATHIHTE